jgi:hypothetical protein
MKHFANKVVPERTERIVDKITCDMCKNKIDYGEWPNDYKTDIKIQESSGWASFGEYCYDKKIVTVDLCKMCFNDVLIPFLKEKGTDLNIEEREIY